MQPPTAAEQPDQSRGLITAFHARRIACVVLAIWVRQASAIPTFKQAWSCRDPLIMVDSCFTDRLPWTGRTRTLDRS